MSGIDERMIDYVESVIKARDAAQKRVTELEIEVGKLREIKDRAEQMTGHEGNFGGRVADYILYGAAVEISPGAWMVVTEDEVKP